MTREFLLAPEALQAIRGAAQARAPAECCGLLVGNPDRCIRAQEVPNLDSAPGRYRLDPIEVPRLQARLSAGERVIGVFHSHVEAGSGPSVADAHEAHEGWVYVIQSVRGGHADEIRAWKRSRDAFEPLVLRFDDC